MRLMCNMMPYEAHHEIFCSDLMFFHWNKSLDRQRENVENVEADPEVANKSIAHVFEIEVHALISMKSCGMYNFDPCRRNLLHAPMSEKAICFGPT